MSISTIADAVYFNGKFYQVSNYSIEAKSYEIDNLSKNPDLNTKDKIYIFLLLKGMHSFNPQYKFIFDALNDSKNNKNNIFSNMIDLCNNKDNIPDDAKFGVQELENFLNNLYNNLILNNLYDNLKDISQTTNNLYFLREGGTNISIYSGYGNAKLNLNDKNNVLNSFLNKLFAIQIELNEKIEKAKPIIQSNIATSPTSFDFKDSTNAKELKETYNEKNNLLSDFEKNEIEKSRLGYSLKNTAKSKGFIVASLFTSITILTLSFTNALDVAFNNINDNKALILGFVILSAILIEFIALTAKEYIFYEDNKELFSKIKEEFSRLDDDVKPILPPEEKINLSSSTSEESAIKNQTP